MNVSTVFLKECVRAGVAARSKKEVIQKIAEIAESTGAFPGYSQKRLYRELDDRERTGSTGFENGIALPHTALPDAERFVAGLLVLPAGVPFESLDGENSTLIFFVIGPKAKRNDHIQIISSISRSVLEPEVRNRLIEAKTDEELFSIVSSIFDSGEEADAGERCMFHIFVQRPEPFDELLTIFSAAVSGSLCVFDGSTAGSYFSRLPLFSAFWTESEERFFKVIVAIVDDRFQNDIIRRINAIVGDIGENPGVLITVQKLGFSVGSLEF